MGGGGSPRPWTPWRGFGKRGPCLPPWHRRQVPDAKAPGTGSRGNPGLTSELLDWWASRGDRQTEAGSPPGVCGPRLPVASLADFTVFSPCAARLGRAAQTALGLQTWPVLLQRGRRTGPCPCPRAWPQWAWPPSSTRVRSCCPAATELTSCTRGCMAHKAWNIYYLTFHRKKKKCLPLVWRAGLSVHSHGTLSSSPTCRLSPLRKAGRRPALWLRRGPRDSRPPGSGSGCDLLHCVLEPGHRRPVVAPGTPRQLSADLAGFTRHGL